VDTLTQRFAELPTKIFGIDKRLLYYSQSRSFGAQLQKENRIISAAVNCPEGREGLRAFQQKVQARFRRSVI
jgi:enoyl-CoA hydratase/carnithine racemase